MWKAKTQASNILPKWIPPPADQYPLSYDVAVMNHGSTTAAICRSNLGDIISAATQQIDYVNPTYGEAVVAKLAIEEASFQHLSDIVIEGDSKYSQMQLATPN